ncbi:hypothetical protein WD376_004318 [Vibrio vulnificus]|nr:hypothetical protein [Vibrio vulnificus]
MKIFTMCMECQKELGHPSFEPIIADYYDEAIAYVECSRGHRSALMLQSHKFEVLLESSANALLEGYTLEAASTLAAAYERFFEFSIKVLCKKLKVDNKEVSATFKNVSRQSERQFGAFLFLHLVVFGYSYKVNEKIATFRNKVVHKGYIPNLEEIRDFGGQIYNEIFNLTQKLKSECSEEIQLVTHDELVLKSQKLPTNLPRATTTGTMFFCLANSEHKPSFLEALESFSKSRVMLQNSMPEMEAVWKSIANNRNGL